MTTSPSKTVWLSMLACTLLLATPVLITDFPVVTDLPQHLGQVRAFFDALANPDGPYRIQWATPYLLGYLLPLLVWLVAAPQFAGVMTLVLCAALWSGAVHLLAHFYKRPVSAAVLACVPFFGTSFQWAFLSFLVGFVLFAVHLVTLERALEAPQRISRWVWLGVATLGLYATHLLWLGAGLLVALAIAAHRKAWKQTPKALLAFAPSLVLAVWSSVQVHQTFQNSTVFGLKPWERLMPEWLGLHALGSARDGVPAVLFVAFAAWLIFGAWQRRGKGEASVPLYVAGLLFLAFALFFPSRYTNTIQFESRWVSPAMAMLALGVSLPTTRLGGSVAGVLLAATSADLSLAWWHVNQEELTGLRESLEALPDNQRVMGLSYMMQSEYVDGMPFIQTFAWAQVWHGGTLNFSFSDFSVMPVVFKESRRGKWTSGLEWFPTRVKREDVMAFDAVLISGDEDVHAKVLDTPWLRPVTTEGRWRLYVPVR